MRTNDKPSIIRKNGILFQSEAAQQHINDIATLAKLKALEHRLRRKCVHVRVNDITLAGLPDTLVMMLEEWGYNDEQIKDIMNHAKNCARGNK